MEARSPTLRDEVDSAPTRPHARLRTREQTPGVATSMHRPRAAARAPEFRNYATPSATINQSYSKTWALHPPGRRGRGMRPHKPVVLTLTPVVRRIGSSARGCRPCARATNWRSASI